MTLLDRVLGEDAYPVDQLQWCWREGCNTRPALGHDFCASCLAWLRGDEPVDPLTQAPPVEPQWRWSWSEGRWPPTGDDEEAWHEYIEATLGACS